MSKRRVEKIDSELRRLLAETLLTDIKDPRFSKMAGVMRVEATSDLSNAKVYISVFDTPEKQTSTLEALKSAEPFLRAKLNEKIKLRRIPVLHFILDDSLEYSAKMSKLIDEVTAKDKENAKHAADLHENQAE